MQLPYKIISATVFTVSYCTSAIAAPYPFTVESQLVGSSYTMTDPTNDGFSDVVSWTPLMGDFNFDLLAIQAYATVTGVYTSPGTYSFLANSDVYWPASNVTWTLGTGQVGVRGVIDWHATQTDYLVVWDIVQNGGVTNALATDVDGDGIRGFRLVNGPFNGFNFALDATLATPIPAAIWLLGSGLLGLVGVARKNKSV